MDVERRMRQVEVLVQAAEHLTAGRVAEATGVCHEGLLREATTLRFPVARSAVRGDVTGPLLPRTTITQRMRIATRDGFVDRYSPERWHLVNPGAVRVIALRVGDEALPTVLSSGTVRAYRGNAPVWWDCWPTVDHRLPWSRGGSSQDDNLVCTSWWRNDTKRAMNTEETGWQVQPAGDPTAWDGLSAWFLEEVTRDPGLLDDAMVRSYVDATRPLWSADTATATIGYAG
jgi:hypothetical protein